MEMELEPDLGVYWSGVKNAAFANRWWFAALVASFLLGTML
jgi:hypothetical protein